MMEDVLVSDRNSLETPREMLELARRAQLEFCVFRHNAHSPGEDAALARVLAVLRSAAPRRAPSDR